MLCRGDIVKDFEIVSPLGSRGMAVAYLARRRGAPSLAVIELMHRDLLRVEEVGSLGTFRAALARAKLDAAHVDDSRLASIMQSLIGHDRDDDPSAQLEFDLSVKALRENDQTTKVPHEAYDEDTVVRDFGAVDEEGNTEVRGCAPLATQPRSSCNPVPLRPRRMPRARAAQLLSLGVLCFAFGATLAVHRQAEPAGTVRRLPASAAFHDAELTATQPAQALPAHRAPAAKRATVLPAGHKARAHRAPKQVARPKLQAHAKRTKR